MNKKTFDIIVCVHNSPKFLEWCLESILQNSDSDSFNLIIVDDFSNEKTKKIINIFHKNSLIIKL